jgi:hypothetical protein
MNFRSDIDAFGQPVQIRIALFDFISSLLLSSCLKRATNNPDCFYKRGQKLYQKEFIKWFKLTAEINPVLKWFRQSELNIPTLYVMGEEDYMFYRQ